MNYEKAKVEVVKFSNEDVITVSALPNHPVCTGNMAKKHGCGWNGVTIEAGLCLTNEKI